MKISLYLFSPVKATHLEYDYLVSDWKIEYTLQTVYIVVEHTVKIFGLFQPIEGCLSCAHVQRSNDNSLKYHIDLKQIGVQQILL